MTHHWKKKLSRKQLFDLLEIDDPTHLRRISWDIRDDFLIIEYFRPYEFGQSGGTMIEVVKVPLEPRKYRNPTEGG